MPREYREGDEERKARSPYDLARYRLEKLQENPVRLLAHFLYFRNETFQDKLAPIPQRREPAKARAPPEFVRNVVGSSAAAGSAEFHIYRNNRRKEQIRLDFMEKDYQAKKLDTEYNERVAERKVVEESKLTKKQRKRQRQKERENERRKKAKVEKVRFL